MQIPFYRYESSKEAYSNVSDVLDGEDIDQISMLESEFLSYIGSKYAIATTNGSSAMHLAMLALDLKRGDKVICSVNAHPNVPEVVRHFDAEPIFIDIDPKTYNIDLKKLDAYLATNHAKKLKAVVITHIAGVATNLKEVYAIAKKYDIRVVEDAQNALGATYDGHKIGSHKADITCFSFSTHLKKNACNGGVLVTNNDEIYQRARLLTSHGMTMKADSLGYLYDIVDIGFDYNISALDAAYARAYLEELDENLLKIKEIATKYNEKLQGVKHITLPDTTNLEHPYLLYIIEIDKNRDSFALELKKEGVDVGLHYIPLNFLTYYKNKYSLKINDFPNALKSYQKILSLPLFATMSDEEVEFVIKKVKLVASHRV